MMNYHSKAMRLAAGSHALYKAMVYKMTGAPLFIESSYEQAKKIAMLTGKDVLCTETRELIPLDDHDKRTSRIIDFGWRTAGKLKSFLQP